MVTPDAWEKVRLGDLGVTYGGLSGKSSPDFGSGDAAYVTFMNVIDNVVLRLSGTDRVRVRPGESQSRLRAGDVIFNGSSETPDEVGLGSAVPGELEGTHLNSFCFGFRPHPGAQLDARFFAYLTRSPAGRAVIRPMAQGSTRYNLAKTNLLNGRFLLPPVKEQEAIAEALVDSDAAIEALDALIAKKRNVKQATMQQLLTGRTRLPGFIEGWKDVNLGEIARMRSGGTPPTSVSAYYGGDTPWASISDMSSSGKYLSRTERTLTDEGLANSAAVVFPAGVLLYAMYASIGECCVSQRPMATSQAILGIECTAKVDVEYLYYVMQYLRPAIAQSGQQGTQSNLNAQMVRDTVIPLPTLQEQHAIAAVLSGMDAEIEALVAQRDKLRLVKQGMMQELLSGRVRLV